MHVCEREAKRHSKTQKGREGGILRERTKSGETDHEVTTKEERIEKGMGRGQEGARKTSPKPRERYKGMSGTVRPRALCQGFLCSCDKMPAVEHPLELMGCF